jgi:hypothetical protein
MPTNNNINAPMGTIGNYLINGNSDYEMFDPYSHIRMVDDFVAGVTKSRFGWISVLVNSATVTEYGTGINANPGIWQVSTGTNAAGGATLHSGLGPFQLGGGRVIVEFLIQVSALSTAAQAYTTRIGLGDTTNAVHVNGCWFEYTDTVNGGNWTLNCADNAAVTTANSNDAVAATTWTRLTIDVNAAANSVAFYVNGTQCANSPVTTNIPTAAGRCCGPNIQIVKSNGTTARTVIVDYVSLYQKFTTGR